MQPLANVPVLSEWFNRLDDALRQEAELAGLLGHSTMIGDAREFLLSRVLKTILPPSVHVGKGVVIDPNGNQSKQVDVVLYDASFPLMETQEGHGLYLVEGVIATIEVKSVLNEQHLQTALDNCVSVGRLALTIQDSVIFPGPISYIFGYKASTSNVQTLCGYFDRWWEDRRLQPDDIYSLPEIILAGNMLGYRFDGRTAFILSEKLSNGLRELSEPAGYRVVMTFWQLERQFGHLLRHLLITISNRLSSLASQALENYLPMKIYNEDFKIAGPHVLAVSLDNPGSMIKIKSE